MSLVPRFVLGALDLTDYPFGVGFGSDLGNPENVSDVLASLLADGEIESLSRRSNRTMTIPILIDGTDLADLAAAEQLLIAECDKQRNTLSINPGDDIGATTIFDTFAAQAVREYDDDTELAGYRRWNLTIKALPFGRSTTKVIDDAGTPPSSSGTLLYNCESTTGWSTDPLFTSPGPPTVDTVIFAEGAGSLRTGAAYWYAYDNGEQTGYSKDTVVGLSLDTDTGGYLSVAIRAQYEDTISWSSVPAGLWHLWMQVDGGTWDEVSAFIAAGRDEQGFVRYVWPVDAGLTITGLRFQVLQHSHTYATAPHTWYDDVELLPAATTDHQIVKQLTVQGSARTTGSLRVAAPSEAVALGQVLAITMATAEIPAGFQPDGRRWVTQGTTTDATALHGSHFTPNASSYDATTGKPIFDIPVSMLTAGPYTVVAMVKAESSSLTFGVQAQLLIDSTGVGPTSETEVTVTGLTTGWQFVTLGTAYLPPLPIQSADAATRVRLLFKGAKMSDVFVIPAWQVGGRPVADFSIVDCGTGTVEPGGPSSSLWIDTPSISQPQGGWWRGPTADRANAQSAWPDAKKPGVHAFNPGSLTAFLVSTGAAGPTLTLEYFPAWFGMAAS